MSQIKNIVVIGAGIAGLKASLDLAKRGFSVTLLEATHRLGGRIYTHYTSDGTAIELGASYWEGYNDNPFFLKYLINRTIRLNEHQSELISLANGEKHADLLRYYTIAKTLLTSSEQIGVGKTFQEYIQSFDLSSYSKKECYWINRFLENALQHHCTPLDWGGFPSFKRDNPGLEAWNDEDADFCFVQQGYDHVIKQLAAECEQAGVTIHLNKPAIKIIDLGMQVNIQTSLEVFSADRVISTIPLGVLKQQMNTLFEPGLSEPKKQAIETLGIHDATRVVLEFSEPFWDNVLGPYLYLDSPELPCLLEFRNAFPLCGKPILLTGKYSDQARKLREQFPNDEEAKIKLIANIISDLRKAFPLKEIPEPIETWIYSWTQNPYAMGAYPYRKAHIDEAMQQALERPEGNIYFAGADFSRFGFSVHNAYFNAEKVCQTLK